MQNTNIILKAYSTQKVGSGGNFESENAKISAVSSLADICFLHVLIRLIRCIIVSVAPRYLSGIKYFAYGYISVLFIRIHPSGLRTPKTHGFVLFYFMFSPFSANHAN